MGVDLNVSTESVMGYRIDTFLFVALALFASNVRSDEITGTVAEVVDGDTIRVSVGLTLHTVRLIEIDTPERDQPWGDQASRALADKLDRARVTVHTTETDRYGRLVSKVLLGSRDINRELVREGHAWVDRQYMRDASLLADERTARRLKVGLWASDNPIEPWRWRQGKRSSDVLDTRPRDFRCGTKRLCGEMRSCEEAFYYLRNCGLRRLDGDSDGVPCESICR